MSSVRGVRHQLSRRTQEQIAEDQMKRLGDFVIACVLLIISSPLLIIIPLAIKCESTGPVLDRQSCIARGGRRFQMLKFRTTLHDPQRAIPPWGQTITHVGRWLRDTRIEALPQLINVLRGEMSIIDRNSGSPSFLN